MYSHRGNQHIKNAFNIICGSSTVLLQELDLGVATKRRLCLSPSVVNWLSNSMQTRVALVNLLQNIITI